MPPVPTPRRHGGQLDQFRHSLVFTCVSCTTFAASVLNSNAPADKRTADISEVRTLPSSSRGDTSYDDVDSPVDGWAPPLPEIDKPQFRRSTMIYTPAADPIPDYSVESMKKLENELMVHTGAGQLDQDIGEMYAAVLPEMKFEHKEALEFVDSKYENAPSVPLLEDAKDPSNVTEDRSSPVGVGINRQIDGRIAAHDALQVTAGAEHGNAVSSGAGASTNDGDGKDATGSDVKEKKLLLSAQKATDDATDYQKVVMSRPDLHTSFGFGLATTTEGHTLMTYVNSNSPADRLLFEGDLVLSLNGTMTETMNHDEIVQVIGANLTIEMGICRHDAGKFTVVTGPVASTGNVRLQRLNRNAAKIIVKSSPKKEPGCYIFHESAMSDVAIILTMLAHNDQVDHIPVNQKADGPDGRCLYWLGDADKTSFQSLEDLRDHFKTRTGTQDQPNMITVQLSTEIVTEDDTRNVVLAEFFETEKSYVEALRTIVEEFQMPLLQSKLFKKHKAAVFSNVDKLLAVHIEFVGKLEVEMQSRTDVEITKPFKACISKMQAYCYFCCDVDRSVAIVEELGKKKNSSTAKVLEQARKNSGLQLPLKDLLQMPKQRVIEYQLLLQKLIKVTPDSHPHKNGLLETANLFKALSDEIDLAQVTGSIRNYSGPPLLEIMPLVKRSDLKVKMDPEKKGKRMHVFLFQGGLVICKAQDAVFKFKQFVPLSERMEVVDLDEHGQTWSLRIESKDLFWFATLGKLDFSHENHFSKTEWMGAMRGCVAAQWPLSAPPNWPLPPPPNAEWEIPRNSIEMRKKIGAGQHGDVWQGYWKGRSGQVAVKKSGTIAVDEFLAEVEIMKKLRHSNIVPLYAACTDGEPVYIVMEMMSHGYLLDYLHDKVRTIDLPQLVEMSLQTVAGMGYLEAQNCIHRDVSARNVLVGKNNICKMANFGLARLLGSESEYIAREGAQWPIKWTAPEAAFRNRFSIKSDVWSFGILLTELITYGRIPYPGMDNAEALRQIDGGYRMPPPNGCPLLLYQIMLDCWMLNPADRPTFETLQCRLEDFVVSSEPTHVEADNVISEDLHNAPLYAQALASNVTSPPRTHHPTDDYDHLVNNPPTTHSPVPRRPPRPHPGDDEEETYSDADGLHDNQVLYDSAGPRRPPRPHPRDDEEEIYDDADTPHDTIKGDDGAYDASGDEYGEAYDGTNDVDIKINDAQVTWGEMIGRGQFGEVFKGSLTDDDGKVDDVAIKCLKTPTEQAKREFVEEANILLDLKHDYIISAKG